MAEHSVDGRVLSLEPDLSRCLVEEVESTNRDAEATQSGGPLRWTRCPSAPLPRALARRRGVRARPGHGRRRSRQRDGGGWRALAPATGWRPWVVRRTRSTRTSSPACSRRTATAERRPGQDADLLVVNTCAFIEAAREESIGTVLELAGAKKDGAKLAVTGCMAERYGPN